MSAGVSDQRMKGQGNQASNVHKEHIEGGEEFESWRQQQENQYASNTTETYNQGAQQFHSYPPFGVGDGTWSSGNENLAILGNYNTSHDNNYGVDNGNGDYNTWNTHQANAANIQQHRKGYDEYYRENVYPPMQDNSLKTMQQGMQGLGLDVNNLPKEKDMLSNTNTKSNHIPKQDQPKESVPKKITWASIASQPAKPQLRTNSTTSTIKKKGPGMPPPPMVPGKHNMDIGTWDSSPKNPPSMLVPTPIPQAVVSAPPTPLPTPIPINSGKMQSSQHGNNSNRQNNPNQSNGSGNQTNVNPAWPAPGDRIQQQQTQNQNIIPQNVTQHNQQSHKQNINHGPKQHHPPNPMVPPHGVNYQNPPPPNMHHMNQPPPPPQMMQQREHPQLPQQRALQSPVSNCSSGGSHPILEQLRDKNNYNPEVLDLEKINTARFFVIKSYSEDDIHRSIKYEIWCSTERGNLRLDEAFRECEKEEDIIYLLFSVNGSGHFCGVAQMISAVDYDSNSNVWSQNKWKGVFKVKWIYVKDVPNNNLRHIKLENNENKSVTNSRDTQEVPNAKGQQVMKIIHAYKHSTSIFDDFIHYEKRQEELEDQRKVSENVSNGRNIGEKYPYPETIPKSYHSGGADRNNHGGGNNNYDKYGNNNYNKNYGGYDKHQSYSNHNRSGYYNNYDNRRNLDDRAGFDRNKDYQDGAGYYQRDINEHYNRNTRSGFGGSGDRNDFRDHRRDDRDRGFNNRDRDNHYESGGYRNDNRNNRDNYRDRGDHHGGGRGGRGRGGGSGGGHRN